MQLSDAGEMVKIPDPTENIELFIFCPAPKGVKMHCRVSRDKKGVDRNMYPTYYLHMERTDGKRVCLFVVLHHFFYICCDLNKQVVALEKR